MEGQGPNGAVAVDNLQAFSVEFKQWDKAECQKF